MACVGARRGHGSERHDAGNQAWVVGSACGTPRNRLLYALEWFSKPRGRAKHHPPVHPPPPPAVQVLGRTPCTGCNQRQQSPTAPHTRFVEIMRHGVLAGRSWRPVVPWCNLLRFLPLGRAAGCVMACGRALSCTCDLHVNQQCHPQVISEAGNVVHDDIATRQRQPAASKTASRVPKRWRDK